MNLTAPVTTDIAYFPADAGDITTHPPYAYDLRKPETLSDVGNEVRATVIHNARGHADLNLDTGGFQLLEQPSTVQDFSNADEVVRVYYEECRTLAKSLTGASHAFTFDHLIREPGRQISGGGIDGKSTVTGGEAGGGYIGFAHMDYTDNSTWTDYLAVHGEQAPPGVQRVVSLNFWRGLSDVVDDYPLGVCDARTVAANHLFETVVYGYGASNYSWHDIGIETFSVKYAEAHRWYYYPRMTRDEVLVFKAFDSQGVIGRACPHSAFANPTASPESPPRRSIELRVLCFITA